MKPFDARLLRYATSTRGMLIAGAALGAARTACTIGFAAVVALAVTMAIDGATLEELATALGGLVVLAVVRGLLGWWGEALARRGAASVKSELRHSILAAIRRLGPSWLAAENRPRIATVTGAGVDALDGYFSAYLPQLILTAVATPMLLAAVAWVDPVSAIAMIVTLPLIPVFMALIGWATQSAQRAQWNALGQLSSAFVDAVGGMTTLTIFGRQHRLAARMRRITAEYRVRTMTVLRVSFLSAFALELAASLAVAVVAVTIGFRLVDGSMPLSAGLFVLLLAPEVFLPIRQVGAAFHESTEGMAAAEDAFGVIQADAPAQGDGVRLTVDQEAGAPLRLVSVRAVHPGKEPLPPVDLVAWRGTITALTGPSGAGKSSVLAAVNGFAGHSGRIEAVSPDRIAWAPQRAAVVAGTIAENIALGEERPDEALVERSLALASATALDPGTVIGPGGAGLSGGQAARVGLARAIYRTLRRDCRLLLLDEPTSALDHATERGVIRGMRSLAELGVAVVVVSHRTAVIDAADAVVPLNRAHGSATATADRPEVLTS